MSSITRPTVSLFTLGCKVNQYESQAIAEALAQAGLEVRPAEEACTVSIINSCTVTSEADRKTRQIIRRVLTRNPHAYVVVTGCSAQAHATALAAIPGVDAVVGNRRKMDVVDTVLGLLSQGKKASSGDAILSVPPLEKSSFEPMRITRFGRTRAYVKIQDGCVSRCTYCAIPAARGPLRSKPIDEVLEEVRGLTDSGCREVVLTGIETGSYGKDLSDVSLADLLERVDGIPRLMRLRLGSLDPTVMTPSFVTRLAALSTLAHHFHLSMQSGSASVLARMRRKYNPTQALSAVHRIREAMPDAELTTDIIVGFPGEEETDFQETVALVRAAQFLRVHVFPYSPREGTPAAAMPQQIPEAVKKQRVCALSQIEADLRRQRLEALCASHPVASVLFEQEEDGWAVGHTSSFVTVKLPSTICLRGQELPVRLLCPDEKGDAILGQPI